MKTSNMLQLIKTDATHPDFIELVRLLDADLALKDGEDNLYYSQFNKIDDIKYAVVAYLDDRAAGCGAIKTFDDQSMEVKRMFTHPDHRGKGVATAILKELEQWATELSYKRCVLETGRRQPEAIQLYEKNGYRRISNYGQYAGIENSVCFERWL